MLWYVAMDSHKHNDSSVPRQLEASTGFTILEAVVTIVAVIIIIAIIILLQT